MADNASDHDKRLRRSAYENLRTEAEALTNAGYVAVRASDLRVVLDILLDVYPYLGDPTACPSEPLTQS